MRPIAQVADQNVEQDDKSSAQGADKKEHLLPGWVTFRKVAADEPNKVEHGERSQPDSSVEVRATQVLESVDNDLVCWIAVVDACDAHHGGNLASSNADGASGHESANCRQSDEFHDPAKSGQSEEEHNRTADDGE